ncbi:MAG: HAD family hydrolase [Ruminococcaceae bacterium]|nr:HAD family hydrolase [Oscillospiraceae bacterium]
MISTLFFDLDATLLPMDQDLFIKTYFQELTKCFSPDPFDAAALIDALWKGTRDMVLNDGSMTNAERFWIRFDELLGKGARLQEARFDTFYTQDFENVRRILTAQRDCGPLMAHLRDKGYRLVLATNPVFPAVAVRTRLSWIGLSPEDFTYVSDYENSGTCKPNPQYFLEILSKIGGDPAECMMIGNNLREDRAALKAGLSLFIIEDHLENPDNVDINTVPHGSYADFERLMYDLPPVSR